MQGVEATPGAGFGPESTLPVSVLLPLPELGCGCVKEAGGVSRLMCTELCCAGATNPLVAWWWVWQALGGGGGGVVPESGVISCWCPPPPMTVFCDQLTITGDF